MGAEPRRDSETPLGQWALYEALALRGALPFVRSYRVSGARHTREAADQREERYPPQYRTDGTLLGHVRFALRHEPLDLRIILAAFQAIGEGALAAWVRREPTGASSRRAWFLYETLTGGTLDVPPARAGNYVDALDPEAHVVAPPVNSPRHRVRDNLLGTAGLCSTVRRTAALDALIAERWDARAQTLTGRYDPDTLARAVTFLYTKETRSSFALEGETPSPNREERFLQALQAAPSFDPASKTQLLRLRNTIVDPRYAAADFRDFQNFVGETTRGYGEYVHFIAPRPEDVPGLMAGWTALTERLLASPLDAVVAAALSAFAFVFIHPFEDGNGRLHRFLMHFVLSRRGFTPPGLIFPVSASMLRDRRRYDAALEAFSKPALTATEWVFTPRHEVRVTNDTRDLRHAGPLPVFRRDAAGRIPVRARPGDGRGGPDGGAGLAGRLPGGVPGRGRRGGHAGPPRRPADAPVPAERRAAVPEQTGTVRGAVRRRDRSHRGRRAPVPVRRLSPVPRRRTSARPARL